MLRILNPCSLRGASWGELAPLDLAKRAATDVKKRQLTLSAAPSPGECRFTQGESSLLGEIVAQIPTIGFLSETVECMLVLSAQLGLTGVARALVSLLIVIEYVRGKVIHLLQELYCDPGIESASDSTNVQALASVLGTVIATAFSSNVRKEFMAIVQQFLDADPRWEPMLQPHTRVLGTRRSRLRVGDLRKADLSQFCIRSDKKAIAY